MTKQAKRCPYVGLMDARCVLVAGDGHEETGHSTDDAGKFKTPAAWRRAYQDGRFRRALTSRVTPGEET
jgi:hypothetical protein